MTATQAPVVLEQDQLEGYEDIKTGGWADYPIDSLAIRDERRSASDVVRRVNDNRLVLDPDFQRGFVWDINKQSRLIESIILRIPLPVFYLAENKDGKLIVVDGRQRLTTLVRFFKNEWGLHLEDRPELHGKRFTDLVTRYQNRLEDCQLHFYIIDQSVPERARLDIFERVNGGEVLTRQQMRNALYNGPATRFLQQEADSDLFQKATGKSLNSRKMQDREFVNRFCSFYLLPIEDYRGDMDKWLAMGLNKMNKMPSEEMTQLSSRFQQSMQSNFEVFGRLSFRKHRDPDQTRCILNAALFDVMSTELAKYEQATVKDKAADFREEFYRLMQNSSFVQAITYGPNGANQVRTRFKITCETFAEVLHAA